MEGRHEDGADYSWNTGLTAGIIPRALHQIFSELDNNVRKEFGFKKYLYYFQDIDSTVRVSYVELYNEQIFDLISQSETSNLETLRIFDDKTKVNSALKI